MVWCSNPHPLEATSVPPAVSEVTQLLLQPLFAVDLLQVVTECCRAVPSGACTQ